MESTLSSYTIKLKNFEGPFDLLFHLIEKNQINLYDIPINEITDQYMDYLFDMQELDLEVASEFLVMAATLLHIKSKMLLPDPRKNEEEEGDPREELVSKLVEYKKYKEFSQVLRDMEKQWEGVYYKLPEIFDYSQEYVITDLNPAELRRVYVSMIERNLKKINPNQKRIGQLVEPEKVTLRSKMREVIRTLVARSFFRFSDLFSFKKRSKLEIVTGFMAILQLAKMNKARLFQKKNFSDILVYRNEEDFQYKDDEITLQDN